MILTVIKTDSGTGAVTLDGSGSETIDGNATDAQIDAQYDAMTLLCDGSEWFIVNKKIS